MSSAADLDVGRFIDDHRFTKYQFGIALLCTFVLMCDNIDLQAIAYTGPSILKEMSLKPAELGPVFSAGLFGMMFGSLLFTPVADRYGRRTVMMIAVPLFALLTMACGFATSKNELILFRFLAGLGFGGAMPNAMALNAEFLPKRARLMLLGFFGAGFTFGGAVSGFIAQPVLAWWGWRGVFVMDGIIGLVAAAAVFVWLPESLRLMTHWPNAGARIAASLKRIDPGFAPAPNQRYVADETGHERIAVRKLFTEGRSKLTIPLWIMSFCILLDLYLVVNWTPILVRGSTIPPAQAILAPALFQVGATISGLTIGILLDRVRPFAVLTVMGVLAAASVAALSTVGDDGTLLLVLSVVCGFCVTGTMTGINLSAVSMYPTTARATGIGWSLGIGRIGSFIGPMIGSALLALDWKPSSLFVAAALPPLIASAAAVTALVLRSGPTPEPRVAPVVRPAE